AREPERLWPCVVSLRPVHDGHLDAGIARPRLTRNGLEDDATVIGDVIERVPARVACPYVRSTNETGSSALRQEIVCLPEPVRHIVRCPPNVGVLAPERSDFVGTLLGKDVPGTEVWRVPNASVKAGPRCSDRVRRLEVR